MHILHPDNYVAEYDIGTTNNAQVKMTNAAAGSCLKVVVVVYLFQHNKQNMACPSLSTSGPSSPPWSDAHRGGSQTNWHHFFGHELDAKSLETSKALQRD